MRTDRLYDVIVIGAGAMGSAAAYHAAKGGQSVLLLEQFKLDHTLGSSNGESRIIRYAYDHPAYIALVDAAFMMWHDLEQASGEQLLIKTGGLDFGRPNFPRFADTRAAMEAMNIPFEVLSPAEVNARIPQLQLDDDMLGLYQADAGVLKASRCVIVQARLAQEMGADFIEDCRVQDIQAHNGGVRLQTSQGDFSGSRLVICAGAWTENLLHMLGVENLHLQPTREQLAFFEAPAEYYADQGAPMPISIGWDEEIYYSIGGVENRGFKAARHFSNDPTTADSINRQPDAAYVEGVRAWLRKHWPQVAEANLVDSRVCLYTLTPDEHFIIDQHPAYPFISFGAGFSGHGFKFSTLIGKILVDLVNQQPIDLDLSLFKANRF